MERATSLQPANADVFPAVVSSGERNDGRKYVCVRTLTSLRRAYDMTYDSCRVKTCFKIATTFSLTYTAIVFFFFFFFFFFYIFILNTITYNYLQILTITYITKQKGKKKNIQYSAATIKTIHINT